MYTNETMEAKNYEYEFYYDDLNIIKHCINQIKNNSLTTVFPVMVSELFKQCSIWIRKM